ncbi:effector-associated constant component EACC1 [Streptomyces aurantiacus]|uniref:effector-associated constant component EACC1 n=1 Tax=Streptomyces aurantiacus TaxID=47760 RepID=UPI0027D88EA5|nr:hypothetical protein [Streptomyces aurantiacus]
MDDETVLNGSLSVVTCAPGRGIRGVLVRLQLGFRDVRGPETELRSLHMWLMADPAARRHAKPALGASHPSTPGAQGDALDLVSLVVSGGFSAASLAMSLVAWRATRPLRPTVTVDRPDGLTVTISGSSPEEARRLIELLVAGSAGIDEAEEVHAVRDPDGLSA